MRPEHPHRARNDHRVKSRLNFDRVSTRLRHRRLAFALGLLIWVACSLSQSAHAQSPVSFEFSHDPLDPTYGDQIQASVTTSNPNNIPPPTGATSYAVDGGQSATAPLVLHDQTAAAYFNVGLLAPGNHTLVWSYTGDSNNQAASGTETLTVNDMPTSVVGSSYQLTPLIYTKVKGNGYGSYGASGVAVDPSGNVFLSFGTSGTGVAPTVGEITAGLDYKVLPVSGLGNDTELALDKSRNLYIADHANSRVVEYSASGVQTTLGISGLQSPVAMTYLPDINSLYILDTGLGGVVQYDLTHSTQTTIFKGMAGLDNAIAVDLSGDVYYGVSSNLYLWTPVGVQQLFYPFNIGAQSAIQSLAYDLSNNTLWVAVTDNSSTDVLFAISNGHTVATFAEDGQYVYGSDQIAVGSDGSLYGTAEVFTIGPAANVGPGIDGLSSGNFVVSRPYAAAGDTSPFDAFLLSGTQNSSTIGGFGTHSTSFSFNVPGAGKTLTVPVYGPGYGSWNAATPGSVGTLGVQAMQPGGMAVVDPSDGDGDFLYVTDTAANTVTMINWNGSNQGTPTIYDTKNLGFTGLVQPTQVAADGAGNVWVLDQGYSGGRISELTYDGVQSAVYTHIDFPLATICAMTAYGNHIYVGMTQSGISTIRRLDYNGSKSVASGINAPVAIALDANGDIYSADATGTLVRIDPTGKVTTIATGLPVATQISLTPDGTVYLSSASGEDILLIAPDGTQSHMGMTGSTNPAIAVVDDLGNISFVDGTNKTAYVDQRSLWVVQNFPSTPVNTTGNIDFTVTNVGNLSAGPFAAQNSAPFALVAGQTNPCAFSGTNTLAPGQSCGLEMQYTPTKQQADSATIYLSASVAGAANCCVIANDIFDVTGKGSTANTSPNPALTPASIDFGNVTVNTTTQAQVATLSNTGNAALSVSNITLMGGNAGSFSQTNNCGSSVAAGSSCTISITCTPTFQGKLTAILTANYPFPLPEQSVGLTCTGTQASTPQASLTPSSVNFGPKTTGTTSAAQIFTLTNAGNAALPITSVVLGGANAGSFAVSANNCSSSLAANTSCTISVTFSPSGSGNFSANLAVVDSIGTQTSTLAGVGITAAEPQATLTPAKADFAGVTVDSSSTPQAFTLSNAGNAALPITSIYVAGTNASDFIAGSNTCGTSLAAGSSCTVSIVFKPAITGSESASLTVVDGVGTQSAALTGAGATAVPPDFTLTGTPSSETGARGTPVSFTLLLGSADPNNPFMQLVNLSAKGLPAGATVTFSPNSVVPGVANAATSTMAVTIPTLIAQLDRGSHDRVMLAGVSVASFLFCFGITGSRWRRSLRLLMLVVFGLGVAGTSLTGCGSGTGFAPPGSTSTITVTGTSGNTSHSVTLTLIVK